MPTDLKSSFFVRITVRLTRAARSHDTPGAREHGARASGPRASGAAECYTARRTRLPHRRIARRQLECSKHVRLRTTTAVPTQLWARDDLVEGNAPWCDDAPASAPSDVPSVLKPPLSVAAATEDHRRLASASPSHLVARDCLGNPKQHGPTKKGKRDHAPPV